MLYLRNIEETSLLLEDNQSSFSATISQNSLWLINYENQ